LRRVVRPVTKPGEITGEIAGGLNPRIEHQSFCKPLWNKGILAIFGSGVSVVAAGIDP